MNGNCPVQNVVYKCTVSATPNFAKRVYPGVAEGDWNQRFYNHKKLIKSKSYSNDTNLSSYLWDLREKHDVFPTLTWSAVKSVHGYSNISKRCLLCLNEKVLIAIYDLWKPWRTVTQKIAINGDTPPWQQILIK